MLAHRRRGQQKIIRAAVLQDKNGLCQHTKRHRVSFVHCCVATLGCRRVSPGQQKLSEQLFCRTKSVSANIPNYTV